VIDNSPYDAVLVVSFGGPEAKSEVIPFLENVLRGRNVSRQRLLAVAEHYYLFDGVSPINENNRQLIAALQKELDANGPHLPIYWGNRNWHPMLVDTIRQMREEGVKRAVAFVTSAYSSYSSCRQYLENIAAAREVVGPDAPKVDKIRVFYNHPRFVESNVENVRIALNRVPEERRSQAQLIFTAHSIPISMAQNCHYEAQLKEVSSLVANAVGPNTWKLAFQSQSGAPGQPWLGPAIGDVLKDCHSAGVTDVVVAPIGFVSDHMEVIYDLDIEAKRLSETWGINMVRAQTAGTHPAFVKMIRELIIEKLSGAALDDIPGQNCDVGCCRVS